MTKENSTVIERTNNLGLTEPIVLNQTALIGYTFFSEANNHHDNLLKLKMKWSRNNRTASLFKKLWEVCSQKGSLTLSNSEAVSYLRCHCSGIFPNGYDKGLASDKLLFIQLCALLFEKISLISSWLSYVKNPSKASEEPVCCLSRDKLCFFLGKLACLLQDYSGRELIHLYLKMNYPSIQKISYPSFLPCKLLMNSDTMNIPNFSDFLSVIFSYIRHGRDLLKFCQILVKCFCNEKQSSYRSVIRQGHNDHVKPDVDLCAAVVPRLYSYLLNKINRKQYIKIFKSLIMKFHKNENMLSFIKDLFSLFKVSNIYFTSCIDSENTPGPGALVLKNHSIPGGLKCKEASTTVDFTILTSTGKEERDVIDGINFTSFETETDLLEYTEKEKQCLERLWQLRKVKRNTLIFPNKKPKEGRIVPTKTRDITKIKGWRNKLFLTDLKNSEKYPKLSSQRNFEKSKSEDKQLSMPNGNTPETKPSIISNSNNPIAKNDLLSKDDLDDYLSSLDLNFEIPDIWDVCFKSKYSHILDKINKIYSILLKRDNFFTKIEELLIDNKDSEIFDCSLAKEFHEHCLNFDASLLNPKTDHLKGTRNSKTYTSSGGTLECCVDHDGTEIKMYFPPSRPNNSAFKIPNGMRETKKKFITVKGMPVFLDYEEADGIEGRNSSFDLKPTEEIVVKKESESDIESPSPKKLLKKDMRSDKHSGKTSLRRSHLSLLEACKSDDSQDIHLDCSGFTFLQKYFYSCACSADTDDHSYCFDLNNKNVQLGAVLNIGYQRPLNNEIIANLELLKEDPIIIDERWANIAASAVSAVNERKQITRIMVPVLSEELINKAVFSLEAISKKIDIESEVENIINDAMDYVVRREVLEGLELSYDPDDTVSIKEENIPLKRNRKSRIERELGRLINVTLVDENQRFNKFIDGSFCEKEHCLKGCICQSLSGSLPTLHCGKEDCMFDCRCSDRNDVIVSRGNKGGLAKEESLWHQTVICKSNDVIIQGDTGKSKREKKLPTRFRNNVLLGKEMNCLDLSPQSVSNWRNFKQNTNTSIKPVTKESVKAQSKKVESKSPPKKDNIKSISNSDSKVQFKIPTAKPAKNAPITQTNTDIVKAPENSIKKHCSKTLNPAYLDILNTKAKAPDIKVSDISDEDLPPDWAESLLEMEEVDLTPEEIAAIEAEQNHPLNFAYIWCAVHLQYKCNCPTNIFLTKNNVLCRSKTDSPLISLLDMSKALSNTYNFSLIHLYNRNEQCARTYGSPFNYHLRNRSPDFITKRKLEIDHDILSNTNSLVKLNLKKIKSNGKSPAIGYAASRTVAEEVNVKEVITKQYFSVVNEIEEKDTHNVAVKIEMPDFDAATSETNNDIAPAEDEMSFKTKRKYRIGPAHFESSGTVRSVSGKSRNFNPYGWPATVDNENINYSLYQPITNSTGFKEPNSHSRSSKGLGLLCLTEGFGYLPVSQFGPSRVSVKDPLVDVYHCFNDVEAANVWLNKFFKSKMLFEDLNMNLKWVLAKPNLLRKLQPFDKHMLESNTKVLNKYGVLVDKESFSADYLRSCEDEYDEPIMKDNAPLKRALETEQGEENENHAKKIKTESPVMRSKSLYIMGKPLLTVRPLSKSVNHHSDGDQNQAKKAKSEVPLLRATSVVPPLVVGKRPDSRTRMPEDISERNKNLAVKLKPEVTVLRTKSLLPPHLVGKRPDITARRADFINAMKRENSSDNTKRNKNIPGLVNTKESVHITGSVNAKKTESSPCSVNVKKTENSPISVNVKKTETSTVIVDVKKTDGSSAQISTKNDDTHLKTLKTDNSLLRKIRTCISTNNVLLKGRGITYDPSARKIIIHPSARKDWNSALKNITPLKPHRSSSTSTGDCKPSVPESK